VLELPLTLTSGVTVPNRLVKAAMTEAMCPSGDPTEGLVALYRAWARHEPGLLITGNMMLDRRYLERVGNVVLDARTERSALRRLAEAVTSEGIHHRQVVNHEHVRRALRKTPAQRPVSYQSERGELRSTRS
jgi:2,4-dienoyl-CoA reductase-like NADH-dependent reductase (Old Yellow Enzyme family)